MNLERPAFIDATVSKLRSNEQAVFGTIKA